MIDSRWTVISTLFDKARELAPGPRARMLDEAGVDHDIRREVEELLQFHDQPTRGLTSPDFDSDITALSSLGAEPLPPGTRIAQFTLQRCVGRGASGVVYEAMQDEPRRIVALKLLPLATTHGGGLRRFHDEVAALGRLQHPAIAQIYESGSDRAGEHDSVFVAMEAVPNAVPITQACATLPIRERIRLFARVCDAVNHAHLRGVIHRDLKPANILIDGHALERRAKSLGQARATEASTRSGDFDLEPKVIDFGVARLLDQYARVGESTLPGVVVGTLQYMSPEQAMGDLEALDVRTDVYSLGVILYRVLCDALPYEVPAHPTIAARIIATAQPTLPSQKQRGAHLDTDLDTIVLTAMAKDHSARYQSAGALAEDLRRWLDRLPIHAKPPSVAKRVRLWARRNPAISALSAALALTIVAGAAFITLSIMETARQRAAAESVSGFLSDMLSSPSVSERGKEVRVIEVLEQAEQKLDTLRDQPIAMESALKSLANSYAALGDYSRALRLHEARFASLSARLDARHPSVLETKSDIADLAFDAGDPARAESLLRELLTVRERETGPASLAVAKACNDLGVVLIDTGRSDEAEAMIRRSLAIRRAHAAIDRDFAHSLVNLGVLRRRAGDSKEAARLFEEGVAVHTRLGTPAHLDLADARRFEALALMDLGELDRARAIMDDVLASIREPLGEQHITTAGAYVALARIEQRAGKAAQADQFYTRAIASYTAALGADHPYTVSVTNERARHREAMHDQGVAAPPAP
jgi:eukaryotic-like serine/threonine-protein kinase